MPNMKLKSMKVDPEEQKEKYAENVAVAAPVYPYGLCLHLDDDAMKKLGLDALPKVGKPVMLVARATVQSIETREYERDGKTESRESMSLQITDLAVGPNETGSEPAAQDVLYAKG